MTDAGTLERAIRAHCLECSGGSRKEVERCGFKACALYPYRMKDAPREKPATGTARQIDLMEEIITT